MKEPEFKFRKRASYAWNIFYKAGKYDIEIREKGSGRARRLPQYAAAVTANIMALAFGAILAWTSPAAPQLLGGSAGFPVSVYEISIIGSLMPVGAAISSVPTGYLTDRLGRKVIMLSLVPICLVGWGLIIWAVNVEMIYCGRLITGMCGGAICVVGPVFTAEISQKEIRGELVCYFQLLLSAGIVLTFAAGSQLHLFHLSIACASVLIVFGIAFLFFPETPVYLLTRERIQDAKKSLKFYRGVEYDAEQEFNELALASTDKSSNETESFWEVFKSRAGLRAFFISIGLMAFMQLCGINATTFYSTTIFEDAGSTIEAKYATIVLGFMQFGGTFIGMFLTDRLGRVILLGTSAAIMAFSMFTMGVYFFLKEKNFDTSGYSWVPLLALSIFTVVFSVGYGPIPWALMPEITPSRIVGTICSIACVFNWVCAFLVTKFFTDLEIAIGSGFTFGIFAIIGTLATVFSFTALPETKCKSLDEIQKEMSR